MGQRDVIPHVIPYGKTSAGMIVRSCFAGSRLGISREEGGSYVVKTEENIRSKSRRSGLCENLDVRRQKPGGVSFVETSCTVMCFCRSGSMGKDLGAAPNEYRLLNRRSATQGSWGIIELRESKVA